jgi:ABC-2 type transport system permease protein
VSASIPTLTRRQDLVAESRKVFAFLRRDFLTAFSYRLPFITDWVSLLVQTLLFAYIGKLIPDSALPTYNGQPVDYLEFVAVGITLTSFLAVGISRLSTALRQEQVQGTLEVMLLTPTAWASIQIGSAFYDIIYVPIRTVIFLALTSVFFGAVYDTSGWGPSLLVLLCFIPVVWGLGIISAAATLTYRRGSGGVGLLITVATLGSGAYVPLYLLPQWVQDLAAFNPIAIAVTALRDTLLGGATYADIWPDVLRLIPMAIASLVLGAIAFRAAVNRERRKGTLGLY